MIAKFDIVILETDHAATRIAETCVEKYRIVVFDLQAMRETYAVHGYNFKKVLAHAAELVDWTRRSKGQLID